LRNHEFNVLETSIRKDEMNDVWKCDPSTKRFQRRQNIAHD